MSILCSPSLFTVLVSLLTQTSCIGYVITTVMKFITYLVTVTFIIGNRISKTIYKLCWIAASSVIMTRTCI